MNYGEIAMNYAAEGASCTDGSELEFLLQRKPRIFQADLGQRIFANITL